VKVHPPPGVSVKNISPSRMYAILGTSGSGKTTLLSLLAGLDVPVEGEVCVNGENILKKA
jgi:putative ABC transport system ATP-binding protein